MSVVSKLPTLVIQKIVNIAAESRLDSLTAWRDVLPLLAVCSAWRHAAKAMVYSRAFIESAEMGVAGQDSIDQPHLLDNNLVSNFDIIVATNSAGFVKSIAIGIETFACLQALVCGKDLKHYLRVNSWTGVVSLNIKLAVRRISYNADPNYIVNVSQYLKRFCDTMAERVPSIVDIRVSVRSKLQICTDFGRLMLEMYLSQLKSLSCSTEILEGIVELPSQLTKLSITFVTGNRVDLPKLGVCALEMLELINAPPNFDLISLATSGKDNIIEFSSLVSLKLGFQVCHDLSFLNAAPETHSAEDGIPSPRGLFPLLNNLELEFTHSSQTLRFLLSSQYCWENVSSLVLSDPSLMSVSNWNDVDESMSDEDPLHHSKVSRCLLQNMPRISKLVLNPYACFSPRLGIQNLSAGYFADQLASVRIDPISMFDFPQFSRDLVSLRIAATEETWLQFPYLNTRALQYLELSNLPFNRFWQIFQNSSIEDTLMFDNLISLTARFNMEEVASIESLEELYKSIQGGKQLIVSCPRLREIFIKNAHSCGLWSIFANKQSVWSSVSKLRIRDRYYSFVRKNDDSKFNMDEKTCLMQLIDILNKRIASQVPNVSDLNIRYISGLKGLDYLFSLLISAYSGQLKKLECNRITKLNVPRFSNRLHTLDIEFDNESTPVLPDLDIRSLEFLALKNLSHEFSWNWFNSRVSLDGMMFSNLSSLKIESRNIDQSTTADVSSQLVRSAANTDDARLTVYMPLVRDVSIDAGNQDWKDWAADIRMNNVTRISLYGLFSTIANICKGLTFNSVGVYYLYFRSVEKEEEALFYEITSNIFRYPRFRNRAMLTLPQLPFDMHLDSVDWTYLTDLRCIDIHFNAMTKLLPRLVNLKSLDYNLVPNYMPDLARDLVNNGGQVLSTSLSRISISVSSDHKKLKCFLDEVDKVAFACSVYLLVLIPSIHDVSIHSMFDWGLADIVEKYAEQFPHLSRLRLN
ncbi:hypothetical protein GGF39_003922 [Coemansia sp. RSA 1721]|nr:hypothetical protein GGF39_003922 [Coemansia sp. RSA 1721]